MLTERVAPSVQQPRTGAVSLESLPDAQLLAQFFQAREDAAFAALLARHGGMVYNVCRRVLSHASDVEDAFQAAFLVLVRKGATLRQPSGLASWLYGVAYRTARKVKARAAVRTRVERKAIAMRLEPDVNDLTLDELRSILDEEIGQLPQKYALPLVLCYLEGKTNAQAAAQLGWPEGSISRRLSRARELLRSRLEKRGLALSVALIAAAFARPASAVPPELAASTLDAGLAVASGAILEEVVSDSTAAIANNVLADLSAAREAALPVALGALILVLVGVISWQLGAPAYAAKHFPPSPEAAGAGCCLSAAGCAHSP